MDELYVIPTDVLNDLCSRFIINIPLEERNDLVRFFFQVELAHWFYLDHYCNENCYNLKPCGIRDFAENIFRFCSFLIPHSHDIDSILYAWKNYKHSVPTNGAIILDESMKNVLLVQGYWAKASWGFPKGKVNEKESEMDCAAREVEEETGYDIKDKIKEDQYLQVQINHQNIRLFIITDVPKSTNFVPKTKNEIKEIKWFPIDILPTHRKDMRCKAGTGFSPNSFFMVIPFLKSLKQWINNYQNKQIQSKPETILTTSQTYPQIAQSSASKKSPLNQQQQQQNLNKDELRKKQQKDYFNQLNRDAHEELKKYQPNNVVNNPAIATNQILANNINKHSNSLFKPVFKNKQTVVNNTPGLINIPNGSLQNAKGPKQQQHQYSMNGQAVVSKSADYYRNQQQPQQQQQQQQQVNNPNKVDINIKIKKQLEFYGPDCWINFKFNFDDLVNDLPTLSLSNNQN